MWQGGVCLGYAALEDEGQRPRTRSGPFEPTPAGEALGPLGQTRETQLPGAPVLQHAMPRAEEWRSLPSSAWAIDVVPTSTGAPKEIVGVAADKTLELRAPDGTVVPTDSITVSQRPSIPVQIEGWSAWRLIVTLVPEPSAT